MEFKATPEECQQLGQRFRVTLPSFKVCVTLSPVKGTKATRLVGVLTACIVQHCGVTLLTTKHNITSHVDVLLCPEEDKSKNKVPLSSPLIKDPSRDDDCEFYQGTTVDIGEILAQYLCMSIDPYFKKSEALLEETTPQMALTPKKVNPFAVLQRLVQDDEDANSPVSSRHRA